MQQQWDKEADVIIVGYGGAGASAAIAAHDAGAKVLIIEKNEGGGNTKLATLTYISPENSRSAKEHIIALSFGGIDDETVGSYLAWTSKNNDFVRELGGDFEVSPPAATFPGLPGAETMIRYRVKATHGELGGESLWNLLSRNVQERKIPVIRQAPVSRLIRSGDEIIGVEYQSSGQRLRACARRAIILTTGGFEYNDQLKREFLAGYPIYAYGHPGNQGDGIKLAQEVGADLWHMKAVAAPMGFKFAEYESAFIMRMPADGYIIVDQNGQRFCNETGLEHYSMWMSVTTFDMDTLKYTRLPSYLIFDDETRRKGPITRVGHGANRSYKWTNDSSREIERGWISKGADAGELAQALKINNPGELAKTLAQYNESCRAGRDEKFNRSADTLIRLEGELYGVPLWPCLLNTQGGPRRNSRGQIVNVWGDPIRRLYGAGELGSIWGFLYQSGGNLGECLGWGRMVGINAAAESGHSS